jgi:hypothetical protein
MTEVFKIELLIVDHDGLGFDEIKEVLEGTRYPNWCISPNVMRGVSHGVEWTDEHPLNNKNTMRSEYQDMFSSGFEEWWNAPTTNKRLTDISEDQAKYIWLAASDHIKKDS